MTVMKSKRETDNSSARKGHCFSKILSLMGGTSAAAPAVWTMETQLGPLGVVPSLFLAVCICPEIHQSQGKTNAFPVNINFNSTHKFNTR